MNEKEEKTKKLPENAYRKLKSSEEDVPDRPFDIQQKRAVDFILPYASPQYHIILFKGNGRFSIDFTEYASLGKNNVLFFSPYQTFLWLGDKETEIHMLTFHGDFYCIEYHKKEVACNGVLFNNIYLRPDMVVSNVRYNRLLEMLQEMRVEMTGMPGASFNDSVLKAYLQLMLALCSREKKNQPYEPQTTGINHKEMAEIQHLFDTYFLTQRGILFYASQVALSQSAFTKKTQQLFAKTPTQLIQDRVVLEAKKLLHLTRKSIKEIAFMLHFDDEFYFSRYFKKSVGLSPLHYRKQVGISIAAK